MASFFFKEFQNLFDASEGIMHNEFWPLPLFAVAINFILKTTPKYYRVNAFKVIIVFQVTFGLFLNAW